MFLNKFNRHAAVCAKNSVHSSRCLQNRFQPLLLQWFPNDYTLHSPTPVHTVQQVRCVQSCPKTVCPPKPCDCPFSPPELSPSEKAFKMLANFIKIILFLAAIEVTWDLGLWSTSDVTQKMYCDLKYHMKDILNLPEDETVKKTENGEDDKKEKRVKKERTLGGLWNLSIIKLFSLLGLHNHDRIKEVEKSEQPDTDKNVNKKQ